MSAARPQSNVESLLLLDRDEWPLTTRRRLVPSALSQGWAQPSSKKDPRRLQEKQIKLEQETLDVSCREYLESMRKMVELGKASTLGPVQKMLVDWYRPLLRGVAEERKAILRGDASMDRRIYGPLLLLLPSEQLAVVALHMVLGSTMKSGEEGVKYSTLVALLGQAIVTEVRLNMLRKKFFDDEAARRRRSKNRSSEEENTAALLPNKGDDEMGASSSSSSGAEEAAPPAPPRVFDLKSLLRSPSARIVNQKARKILAEGDGMDWPTSTLAKVGSRLLQEVLKVAVDEKGEPYFYHDRDARIKLPRKQAGMHSVRVGVVRARQDLLDSPFISDVVQKSAMPRFLPMVVPPNPWRAFDRGGFLRLRSVMMRTHGLQTQAEAVRLADMPAVYQGLDALGKVPWRINADVYDLVSYVWQKDMGFPDLPLELKGKEIPYDEEPRWRDFYDVMDKPPDDGGGGPAESPRPSSSSQKKEEKKKPKWPQRQEAAPTKAQLEALKASLSEEADVAAFEAAHLEYTQALTAWRRKVAKARKRAAENHSLRCDVVIKLGIAERFKEDERIYFPYNVDFRGRAYPIPPNLNHLGNDMCRGLLKFAEEKPLGKDGLFWLKVHLANLFGKSKMSLDDRRKFADDHVDLIFKVADEPLDERWWLDADEPWQALAACKEIAAAIRHPTGPESYPCSLPVHADGSCNGLQHYAALGRDHHGGDQVNLTPGDTPRDVYAGVCDLVVKKLAAEADAPLEDGGLADFVVDDELVDEVYEDVGLASSSSSEPSHDGLASSSSSEAPHITPHSLNTQKEPTAEERAKRRDLARIVEGMIDRKVVKQTVMTSVYGVTFVGARQQILRRLHDKIEELLDESGTAGPRSPSDEEERRRKIAALEELGVVDPETKEVSDDRLYHASCYVATLTLEVLAELFTSARLIMDWLAQCARLVALDGQPVSWITPLGLPVTQPYRRDAMHSVRTMAQVIVLVDHSEKLPVSTQRQKTAFPPNFIHSLDSTHMLLTAIDMERRGLTFTAVHDSYWTHPADVPAMNDTLRSCFLDLYSEPVLENLLESFQMRFPHIHFPPIPERGQLDLSKVRHADYFFS